MPRKPGPPITKPCENCGKDVTRRRPSDFRAHVFCSHACYAASPFRADVTRAMVKERNPGARVTVACAQCGTDITRAQSQLGKRSFCDRDCQHEFLRSQGIRQITAGGYVRLYVGRDHPGATKTGHIFEHRKVMQEILGRPLVEDENVHHVNGVRDDNRPENLELWSSSQPKGQLVADKIRWAREFLSLYENAPEGVVNGDPKQGTQGRT